MYNGASFNTTGKKREGPELTGIQRGLNSTGKWEAFSTAFNNARNMMLKDNGRDNPYVPNPTVSATSQLWGRILVLMVLVSQVVSFTGNSEPMNYTKLDSDQLQDVLGDIDCQHLASSIYSSGART